MEEYILNESLYDSIYSGQYSNKNNAVAYNTIPLLALYVEKKKKGVSQPIHRLRQLIESCPGLEIETELDDLLSALSDDEFRDKHVSKAMNPFILSDYISIVHREYHFWDSDELCNQLYEYYGNKELHY